MTVGLAVAVTMAVEIFVALSAAMGETAVAMTVGLAVAVTMALEMFVAVSVAISVENWGWRKPQRRSGISKTSVFVNRSRYIFQ